MRTPEDEPGRAGNERPNDPEWIEPTLPDIHAPLEVPPSIQRHNRDDLLRMYYAGTSAPRAIDLFDWSHQGRSKVDLAVLLRDHRERGIRDSDELEGREAFDDLLTCYSVLEIALQLEYIAELDPEFTAHAAHILGQPPVRAFYQDFYPLLLPRLFRARIDGEGKVRVHCGPRQVGAFQRVLELDARYLHQTSVQRFLALADDFVGDSFSRQLLLDAVNDPEEFAHRMARPAEKRDRVDEALLGLWGFLSLSDGLYRALEGADGDKICQSSLWHFFGYWYDQRSAQIIPSLWEILERFDSWPAGVPSETAGPDLAEPSANTDRLRTVVVALSSDRYRWPLLELAERIIPGVEAKAESASAGFTEAAVRHVVGLVTESAHARGVNILTDISTPLPAALLGGVAFSRALHDILTNAVAATDRDGSVTVAVDAEDKLATLRLTVTCSLAREQSLERLFEPFYSTKGPEGTGLGLAISRALIESVRGEVAVEAAGERGMRIRVTLPVAAG